MSVGVLMLSASETVGQTPVWKSLSSGAVNTITCDGQSKVFLGMQGGVAVSSDRGLTWPILGVNNPVHSLLLDGEGRLFAGGERGNIYVSMDGGGTWSVASTGSNATFNGFCADKNGIVYTSAESYGIYTSTDHGLSWHGAGFSGISVFAVGVNSQNTLFAARYGGGLYQSTDKGTTWIKTGLASTAVRTLVVGPQDELLAGVQNDGVYRSTDGGVTWTPYGLSGVNVTYLTISPAGVPFAATTSTLYSTAGDTLWTPVSVSWATQTVAMSFMQDNAAFAVTGGEVYVREQTGRWFQCGFDTRARATNGLFAFATRLVGASAGPGILIADSGGGLWRSRDTGLSSTEVRALARSSGGALFAGTADGRILVSQDSGEHWEATSFAAESSMVFVLAADENDRLIAGTLGDGVFCSIDGGNHWNPLNDGLGSLFVRTVLSCSKTRMLAGTDEGLYVSTDNGVHWSSMPSLGGLIWCLAQDKSGRLLAGTGEKGVFQSTDEGTSWSTLNEGLTCLSVRSIAIDSSGRFFAGTLGGGVFERANSGEAWIPVNNGLGDPDIVCLLVSSDGTLYAGTRQSWIFKMPMGATTDVAVPLKVLPGAASLKQNYPNPFNPSTVIEYTVAGDGDSGFWKKDVSLAVYDILGREIARLVDEQQGAGTYQVTFSAAGGDGSRLASGVYIYRLKVGAFVDSRRMLLIR
jgi:hypothetical protein